MDTATKKPPSRVAGCTLLAIGVPLALVFVAWLYFHPYNRVAIKVTDVPPDTVFLCIVADSPQGPTPMLWSLEKVGPFTMHPDRCSVSWHSKRGETSFWARVIWSGTGRVGVLLKSKSGKWRIAWFAPEQSQVQGHSLLSGGGTWHGSLRDATQEQTLAEDEVRALGFDYALKNHNK